MKKDRATSLAIKDQQQSDGLMRLSPQFFENLHQLEVKYIRLRYCKTSKQNESQLIENIEKLVACYTDCIDYFSNISQNVQTYYQAKLKDVVRFYELYKNASAQTYQSFHKDNSDQLETIQDLGSISSQTRLEIMIEERDESVASKELFNQNVMVCLQSQNIDVHLKENMKKKDKVNSKINQSLQIQADDIQKRIKVRKIRMSKKKGSQSFSQQTTFQADLKKHTPLITEQEQIEQIMDFNMEALDLDSPQKLKQLIQSKSYQLKGTQQDQI